MNALDRGVKEREPARIKGAAKAAVGVALAFAPGGGRRLREVAESDRSCLVEQDHFCLVNLVAR